MILAALPAIWPMLELIWPKRDLHTFSLAVPCSSGKQVCEGQLRASPFLLVRWALGGNDQS